MNIQPLDPLERRNITVGQVEEDGQRSAKYIRIRRRCLREDSDISLWMQRAAFRYAFRLIYLPWLTRFNAPAAYGVSRLELAISDNRKIRYLQLGTEIFLSFELKFFEFVKSFYQFTIYGTRD